MRIAVCDDNPKELERIKGCFCRIQGYDLVCSYFDSTSTVMEILKTENSPYDLYILDIEMPGMNGLKLAKYQGKRQQGVVCVPDQLHQIHEGCI